MTTFHDVFDAMLDKHENTPSLKARAELMHHISSAIFASGMTQKQAAIRCGTSPQRISDLLNGRLSKFSLDALVDIASSLGTVSVTFKS